MQFYVQDFTSMLCSSSLTPIKVLIRLSWTSVTTSYVPPEMGIDPKMLMLTSFLRKGKLSRIKCHGNSC